MPGDAECDVAAHRDHRVHRVGLAAVEDAEADAGGGGGEEARRARRRGAPRGRAWRPGAREPVHGPAALARLALEPARRVGRTGVADEVEQLDVLAAVGVGEAGAEVDAELLRELLDRAPLARAPEVRTGEVAGELAVDHLEAGAEHVLDVEIGGHRLDLERQRRRRQHDRVALALVRGDERARFGVDAAGELLLEQLPAELVDVVDRRPAPRAAEDRDDRVVVGLAEHETDPGHQRRARPPAARRRAGAAGPLATRARRTRR